MPKLTLPLFLGLLLLGATGAGAQSLFASIYDGERTDAAVAATLSLPLDSLDARSEAELPGHLVFTDRGGTPRILSAEVSARGRFRRQRCGMPPLRLDFSKSELQAVGLTRDFDKYKLVIPCYDDSSAVALLLKEYLAYRAYAMLSPAAHFRAQLLELTLRDATGSHPDRRSYAFLIEETDEMARRTGGRERDSAIGLPAARYDAYAEASHALFQYLIGNADWSLPLQRNLKVVERPNGVLLPVGYDFDFSGWVGAPYASPSPEVGQRSIYERVYLGYVQNEAVLGKVMRHFAGQRRELLRLVKDFALLPDTDRQVLVRFVRRFYHQLYAIEQEAGTKIYDQLRHSAGGTLPPGAAPEAYGMSAAEPAQAR